MDVAWALAPRALVPIHMLLPHRVLGIDVSDAVTKALTVDEEAVIPYVTQASGAVGWRAGLPWLCAS